MDCPEVAGPYAQPFIGDGSTTTGILAMTTCSVSFTSKCFEDASATSTTSSQMGNFAVLENRPQLSPSFQDSYLERLVCHPMLCFLSGVHVRRART